jgi:uncharacterized protein YndB with AHSA1/START domain
MAHVSIEVAAAPEVVWSVLADADAYGDWVVGTKNVVRADAGWPQVGTALEYELGVGPISIGDRTVVVESEPPRLLVLRAQLRHVGAASIRLELEPHGEGTRVLMDEAPVEGPLETLHNPISDRVLERRNDAALGRLKEIAEAHA